MAGTVQIKSSALDPPARQMGFPVVILPPMVLLDALLAGPIARRIEGTTIMKKHSLCRNLLPQEQLCARDVVTEAEEGVLAAKVDLATFKGLCSSVGDWVVRDAFEVQCAAVGGENVEKHRGDVLTVIFACCEVLYLVDGRFIAWGRRCCGCGECDGAAEGCSDRRNELHCF